MNLLDSPVLPLFPSFSLLEVLCDPTDLIWRKKTPFEAMADRTAPSSDVSYLRFPGVFLSCKENTRRSMHSPQDHFIIILITSDRLDWRDTRDKWPLARNPDRSTATLVWNFFGRSPQGSMDNRNLLDCLGPRLLAMVRWVYNQVAEEYSGCAHSTEYSG